MKLKLLFFLLITLSSTVFFTACEKEVEVLVDSSQPQGAFTASKSGTIVEQNATGSKGAVQIGTDTKSVQFLNLGTVFVTNLATGTVSVYLSTSETFKADPAKGNPDLRLIGTIARNGEHYFKTDPTVQSKFTHLILWCGSANVPFGNAKLQ